MVFNSIDTFTVVAVSVNDLNLGLCDIMSQGGQNNVHMTFVALELELFFVPLVENPPHLL